MFCLLAACSELDQMRAALVVFGEIGRTNGGNGAVRGAVHPGRPHHLRQLPGEAAGQVRLRVRAQERRELCAPPRQRLRV
jgi:hypothetical protein